MLTSTLPLPTCKNLGLYEALNRSSADVEETHRTLILKFTVYVRGNSLLLLIIFNNNNYKVNNLYQLLINPFLDDTSDDTSDDNTSGPSNSSHGLCNVMKYNYNQLDYHTKLLYR